MITGNYINKRQYVAQLGMMAASAGMGLIQDLWQQNLNKKAEERGKVNSKEMMDYQMKKQMEMWEKTGYGAQMEQMRKAGLNPGLMYGMSGGGGQTTGSVGATQSGIPTLSGIGGMMGMGLQAGMMAAQIKQIEAQTEKTKAETPNVKADTENKILQAVILEYTGKEMKDTYSIASSPEMRQNQAGGMKGQYWEQDVIGTQLMRMHSEGQLSEKSYAELEQILLQNANTREQRKAILAGIENMEENTKGVKLDNIIKDLEMRLQKETGIDRNSPTWLKVLGRLFVELMNK